MEAEEQKQWVSASGTATPDLTKDQTIRRDDEGESSGYITMKAADGGQDYTAIQDKNSDENSDEAPANGDQLTAEVTCEETDL